MAVQPLVNPHNPEFKCQIWLCIDHVILAKFGERYEKLIDMKTKDAYMRCLLLGEATMRSCELALIGAYKAGSIKLAMAKKLTGKSGGVRNVIVKGSINGDSSRKPRSLMDYAASLSFWTWRGWSESNSKAAVCSFPEGSRRSMNVTATAESSCSPQVPLGEVQPQDTMHVKPVHDVLEDLLRDANSECATTREALEALKEFDEELKRGDRKHIAADPRSQGYVCNAAVPLEAMKLAIEHIALRVNDKADWCTRVVEARWTRAAALSKQQIASHEWRGKSWRELKLEDDELLDHIIEELSRGGRRIFSTGGKTAGWKSHFDGLRDRRMADRLSTLVETERLGTKIYGIGFTSFNSLELKLRWTEAAIGEACQYRRMNVPAWWKKRSKVEIEKMYGKELQ
ncbi:hypothetical protein BJ742DRAFT_742500 [Cladochytrium replicatum]|nr:hypothetical protein BJ742DRAFT_742500 [Cladochytrium replicatum]